MSDDKEVAGWKPGESGNPNGRPKKAENASDLRTIKTKLRNLTPRSFKVIEASLGDGKLDDKEVTKEQVNTAKWVANTYVTVHKAIVAEEQGGKPQDDDEELNLEETRNTLSLVMVK